MIEIRSVPRVVAGCGMGLGLLLDSCSFSSDDAQMDKINAGIYFQGISIEVILYMLINLTEDSVINILAREVHM